MRKYLLHILIISFVFILTLLASPLHAQQTTTVTRIVDGDTLKVFYLEGEESIRLIGIDTPESRVNKKTKKDAKRSGQDIETIIAMGKRATEYVESLVKPGGLITIEFDVQERDRYKRLLGYVYLPNGNMLNEEIVKAGYASVMTIPPNVKYKDRFLIAYQEARESKRGLWGEWRVNSIKTIFRIRNNRTNETIKCPNCDELFELSEAISYDIEKRIKKKHEIEIEEKRKPFAK